MKSNAQDIAEKLRCLDGLSPLTYQLVSDAANELEAQTSSMEFLSSLMSDRFSRNVSEMSIRTHLAGLAMQGILADPEDHEDERQHYVASGPICSSPRKVYTETCSQAVARIAVQQADDLIAELIKTQQPAKAEKKDERKA